MTPRLANALRDPDEESRLDKLSALVVDARFGKYEVTPEDADAALRSVQKETERLPYMALWKLLERGPRNDGAYRLAKQILKDELAICRGEALYYLLKSYPEEERALREKYGEDRDPYVQDALARFLAKKQPKQAVRHWTRVLESDHLTHDLSESTPLNIADAAEERDIDVFEERNREARGKGLWGVTAALIRRRLHGGR